MFPQDVILPVLSPCLYTKTELQISVLDWEQSCGALLASFPSLVDV